MFETWKKDSLDIKTQQPTAFLRYMLLLVALGLVHVALCVLDFPDFPEFQELPSGDILMTKDKHCMPGGSLGVVDLVVPGEHFKSLVIQPWKQIADSDPSVLVDNMWSADHLKVIRYIDKEFGEKYVALCNSILVKKQFSLALRYGSSSVVSDKITESPFGLLTTMRLDLVTELDLSSFSLSCSDLEHIQELLALKLRHVRKLRIVNNSVGEESSCPITLDFTGFSHLELITLENIVVDGIVTDNPVKCHAVFSRCTLDTNVGPFLEVFMSFVQNNGCTADYPLPKKSWRVELTDIVPFIFDYGNMLLPLNDSIRNVSFVIFGPETFGLLSILLWNCNRLEDVELIWDWELSPEDTNQVFQDLWSLIPDSCMSLTMVISNYGSPSCYISLTNLQSLKIHSQQPIETLDLSQCTNLKSVEIDVESFAGCLFIHPNVVSLTIEYIEDASMITGGEGIEWLNLSTKNWPRSDSLSMPALHSLILTLGCEEQPLDLSLFANMKKLSITCRMSYTKSISCDEPKWHAELTLPSDLNELFLSDILPSKVVNPGGVQYLITDYIGGIENFTSLKYLKITIPVYCGREIRLENLTALRSVDMYVHDRNGLSSLHLPDNIVGLRMVMNRQPILHGGRNLISLISACWPDQYFNENDYTAPIEYNFPRLETLILHGVYGYLGSNISARQHLKHLEIYANGSRIIVPATMASFLLFKALEPISLVSVQDIPGQELYPVGCHKGSTNGDELRLVRKDNLPLGQVCLKFSLEDPYFRQALDSMPEDAVIPNILIQMNKDGTLSIMPFSGVGRFLYIDQSDISQSTRQADKFLFHAVMQRLLSFPPLAKVCRLAEAEINPMG